MDKKERQRPPRVTVRQFTPHPPQKLPDWVGDIDDLPPDAIIMLAPVPVYSKLEEKLIDCKTWVDRSKMHDMLKEELGFSPHYGENLDALFDELNSKNYRLTLYNAFVPLHHMRQYMHMACRVMDDAAALDRIYMYEIRPNVDDFIDVDNNVGMCPPDGWFYQEVDWENRRQPPDEPMW